MTKTCPHEDGDRETFLEILRRTKERYGYLLHAYQQVILIVRSLPKQEFEDEVL